ncbi:hypothetical protein CFC21_031144 [Triticum aestivum]|uniref:Transport and Golgi organization 2-like protein n=3 Tax=Triticinae TaxID=1648030 RepID=A0A453CMG3_AEGTS|nr:transport and Golgi organization 2 homolog isoform X4 [Triticum aestivum]KAF7017755.1 hypothetical protein CFC21_031144 [Triticum aestivum]
MCIAAWTWQAHPAYGLLLLFNRDEYHSRPTRPAQWWAAAGEEGEEILGGRDELGGGTWLGCTKGGKLAFLTNVREPSPRDGARSRGELPVRAGRVHWSMQLKLQRKQISTMVLILYWLMCIQEPWCTSLISQVLRLGQSFNRFLAAHDDAEVSLKQMVEELMTDTVKADRSAVPDTGVDPDWEYQLSSIFIDTKKGQARYGTRSMAAIGVKLDGEVTFYERSLASSLWNENVVQFEMDMAQ